MSFLLSCPRCGVREVTDFGCAGEVTARRRSRPNEVLWTALPEEAVVSH